MYSYPRLFVLHPLPYRDTKKPIYASNNGLETVVYKSRNGIPYGAIGRYVLTEIIEDARFKNTFNAYWYSDRKRESQLRADQLDRFMSLRIHYKRRVIELFTRPLEFSLEFKQLALYPLVQSPKIAYSPFMIDLSMLLSYRLKHNQHLSLSIFNLAQQLGSITMRKSEEITLIKSTKTMLYKHDENIRNLGYKMVIMDNCVRFERLDK